MITQALARVKQPHFYTIERGDFKLCGTVFIFTISELHKNYFEFEKHKNNGF